MSHQEREQLHLQDNNLLTYGEVDFNSIAEVIWLCKKEYGLKNDSVFWDLGHGTGKALVAAALTGQFKEVNGVEFLAELHKQSEQLKIGWQFWSDGKT